MTGCGRGSSVSHFQLYRCCTVARQHGRLVRRVRWRFDAFRPLFPVAIVTMIYVCREVADWVKVDDNGGCVAMGIHVTVVPLVHLGLVGEV